MINHLFLSIFNRFEFSTFEIICRVVTADSNVRRTLYTIHACDSCNISISEKKGQWLVNQFPPLASITFSPKQSKQLV